MRYFAILLLVVCLSPSTLFAREVGDVNTVFKFIGPDHKIVVEAFEDPKVAGITCFISRAKSGGISGAVGVASDPSEASVACRQTGRITFNSKIDAKEDIFTERASILFKKIHVVRFYDATSNSLVYLVYSDKLIDGSPKNSISAVWLDGVRPPN